MTRAQGVPDGAELLVRHRPKAFADRRPRAPPAVSRPCPLWESKHLQRINPCLLYP